MRVSSVKHGTLASLNHPNIAAVYGLEESGAAALGRPSPTAIVMELVEGETLAERLERGPLPLAEALDIAGQIAEALGAAHEKGIVHRDLKPANVKLTSTGAVKVLDFGVAKILTEPAHDDVTLSAATGPAVVLGTPAYMAPEQAQGQSADTRVDVWAFGVVLYEMVTGVRLFRGDSVQATLVAVFTADPKMDRVPPTVRPLLGACLERDPRKRLRDIADDRFLLSRVEVTSVPARRSPVRSFLIAAASLGALMLVFFAGKWLTSSAGGSTPATAIRLSTMLPVGVSVTRGPGYTSSVAVSPDGRTLVIAASDEDGQRLYRRSLARLDPAPIAGTERGTREVARVLPPQCRDLRNLCDAFSGGRFALVDRGGHGSVLGP